MTKIIVFDRNEITRRLYEEVLGNKEGHIVQTYDVSKIGPDGVLETIINDESVEKGENPIIVLAVNYTPRAELFEDDAEAAGHKGIQEDVKLGYKEGKIHTVEATVKNREGTLTLKFGLGNREGIEYLKKLRKHDKTKNLRIVMITGGGGDSYKEECRKLGATAYIGGPISNDELVKLAKGEKEVWDKYNPQS